MAKLVTENSPDFTYIVIGGGIAGVTCVEHLSFLCPTERILLISASPLFKVVTNLKQVSRTIEEFDVQEIPSSGFRTECDNVQVVIAAVNKLDSSKKEVHASNGNCYKYNKLCICTGAKPKVISDTNPYVLGIRDTETVKVFQEKLKGAQRIIIVGNGGIATELAYEIEGCEIIWAIKDTSIGSTFFDAGTAQFFIADLNKEKQVAQTEKPLKRLKYTASGSTTLNELGSALGPDWADGLNMTGSHPKSRNLTVEYECEVAAIQLSQDYSAVKDCHADVGEWPVYVTLTNGKTYGCDLLVSATGVLPNTCPFTHGNGFLIGEDGGLRVDDQMKTSVTDVFAAGDVCYAAWNLSKHWFQMRLWTQARQMGAYAAKCMAAALMEQSATLDFCFEMFAHVTKFFHYKVVLLGLFNGQGLGNDYEMLLRVTKGVEYVKVILQEGKMQGAILIGDTDLEETFENLILNQMDLTRFGEHLLDPAVDIEDYFD